MQGCARLMSRGSNLTRLWLKWVESELSRTWKSRIWVVSESNYADRRLSQSWVTWILLESKSCHWFFWRENVKILQQAVMGVESGGGGRVPQSRNQRETFPFGPFLKVFFLTRIKILPLPTFLKQNGRNPRRNIFLFLVGRFECPWIRPHPIKTSWRRPCKLSSLPGSLNLAWAMRMRQMPTSWIDYCKKWLR